MAINILNFGKYKVEMCKGKWEHSQVNFNLNMQSPMLSIKKLLSQVQVKANYLYGKEEVQIKE